VGRVIGWRLALYSLAPLIACAHDGGGARPDTASADRGGSMAEPVSALIELAVTETGERYRIADDGRYLVTGSDGVEHEQPPMSKIDRGTRRLTSRALARLRDAISQVGFSALPDSIPGIESLPAGARPTGSGRFTPRTFVFTVNEGAPKSVRVRADGRVAESFGTLAPLWQVLDEEALGGWRHE
jgi:hypothetical protein